MKRSLHRMIKIYRFTQNDSGTTNVCLTLSILIGLLSMSYFYYIDQYIMEFKTVYVLLLSSVVAIVLPLPIITGNITTPSLSEYLS